jgi:methyl-accepting chemotaxis protein
MPRPALAAPAKSLTAPLAQPRHDLLAVRVWLLFGTIVVLVAAATVVAAVALHGMLALAAMALGAAAVIGAAATASWLLRDLVSPLAAANEAARRIDAGDLATVVDARRGRALQSLLQSLNDLHERIFGVVTQVRIGTGNVAVNSSQIAKENDALEQRTLAQADSVQHTAASLEELTANVRQGAATVRDAHALTRAASERAGHGGTMMAEVVQTMDAIQAGSHSIRDIIGVIDGIAFQTNLLALNAAVEAARAGEQGRGFAVVAAEVRTLAQRCAEAAREIRGLIVDSVDKVDAGSARVQQARAAMESIVASVREVSDLIAHIDASMQEQDGGLETVNGAVAKIDRATQRNARLVTETTRTSLELRQGAADLFERVSSFRLGDREHGLARDAVDLVQRGCEYLQAHGRQALLDEVNRLDFGQFTYRDLYLMVLDDGATFIAHGNNPSRVGTGSEVRDVEGKAFPRELVRLAREQGEGWVDYKWVHPVTEQVFTKSGYVRRVDDLYVYAAVYKA